jgi:hypothetical protein
MTDYTARIAEIAASCRDFSGNTPQFKPASADDAAWLEAAGLPATVVTFFAAHDPVKGVESDGVYLEPVRKLRLDNTQAVPGVVVNQYGWVVIANTVSGDAYCVDTRSEGDIPVYIVSHARGEDASFDDIKAHSRIVAQSFDDFLEKFAQKALPYDVELAG